MATVRSAGWDDACAAAAILAVDPTGVGGISLRSAAGPIRDRWLAHCRGLFPGSSRGPSRWNRVPLNVADDRLLGGLDLSATLAAGRPIAEQGLLASADGGVILLSMAERISCATAAKIGSVLDRHEVVLERDGFARRVATRFAVVALDEGIAPDERPPQSLLDRLALHVDLEGLSVSDTAFTGSSRRDIIRARSKLPHVRAADEVLVALCEVAKALGVESARGAWLALRVARAITALADRVQVVEDDIALAARLVLASRAVDVAVPESQRQAEAAQPQEREQEDTPQGVSARTQQALPQGATGVPESATESPVTGAPDAQDAQPTAGSLGDRVLSATRAALPANFLAQLQPAATRSTQSGQTGRTGSKQISRSRGRPAGITAGEPRAGVRVNVIETLRAAAPWQRIRRLARQGAAQDGRAEESPLIQVFKHDIRIMRYMRRSRSTTIFLVDASGSAALNRLAEVKGAVELMLAESYVRRDRVAMISFRGTSAQLLLPPTNSLVRAKRELASLPGGGGTPLALGIDTARSLADTLKRRGESPVVVVLTDGRPNIARDGKGNRVRAEADAVSAARLMRTNSIAALMVDTAPQPRSMTEQFAREMGAKYVPLPYASASSLANAVHECGLRGRTVHDRHFNA